MVSCRYGKRLELASTTPRYRGGGLELDLIPLPIHTVVDAAVDSVRLAAAQRGLEIRVESSTTFAAVLGSADRLHQVFVNLLGNSVKFSEGGRSIDLSVTALERQVQVAVRDHGIGIAPEVMPHLFERFWQAERTSTRRRGGLGLGLSIARHIVELHRGEITVHSDGTGLGATFTVILPLHDHASSEPETPVRRAVADAEPAVSLTGIRVLAVDDEASALEILSAVLIACGATATAASSVASALRAFERERPDVVVSDIAMPDVDGFGLVAAIRAMDDPASAATPVLALTAYGSLEDRRAALAAGFDRHLAKPIRAGLLSRTLLDLVRRRVG